LALLAVSIGNIGLCDRQVEYVMWRDGVVQHGGDRKSKSRLQIGNLDRLPATDPGDLTTHCCQVHAQVLIIGHYLA
jgi:hypothetical protein